MARKTNPSAVFQNLPDGQQAELWEALTVPAEGSGKPLTYREALAWAHARWGVSSSVTALSGWFQSYGVRRRIESAQEEVERVRLEWLKSNPGDADVFADMGQMLFLKETMANGDVKMFARLKSLHLEEKRQRLEEKKLHEAVKTKLEAGLDALYAEISGNPAAVAIFEELKREVAAA
jgi:hypothetical protein